MHNTYTCTYAQHTRVECVLEQERPAWGSPQSSQSNITSTQAQVLNASRTQGALIHGSHQRSDDLNQPNQLAGGRSRGAYAPRLSPLVLEYNGVTDTGTHATLFTVMGSHHLTQDSAAETLSAEGRAIVPH